MPFHCSVPNCRGNYDAGPKVTVFKFPNDERMQKIWLSRIGRDNFAPSTCSRVCHLHFEKEDVVWETRTYDARAGRVITVGLEKPLLKPGAVPSLFPKCPAYAPKSRYREQENENLKPENEQPAPSLLYTSNTQNTLSLIFLGEFLVPTNQVEFPCSVAERVYHTIWLSDHNYARPYHSQPKKNCEDVADCNSETSDRSSCIAGRPPVVPQGSSVGESRVASGGDVCGSRVGRPATSSRLRGTSYSQYHCAVYRCATNCHRTPGVSCHAFPKDERLRREWLARCGRKSEVNVKNSRVCSVHFRPEDYERDLRNELLGLPLRRILIPTAVPTLNLPSEEEDEPTECRDVSTKRSVRSRKKLRKCAANSGEGDKMESVVQQILMNPPEVIIKEEPVVKEEAECDVGAGAQQDFEFVSVKEEPVEDPDESTSPAPEESCEEEKGQDQQSPPIIKEEIDCDDYINPLLTS